MATNENELDLWNEIYNFLISENEKWEQEQANRLAGSGAQYVSNGELGSPTYRESLMNTNAKIIRQRLSGMKVGEWAYFPEMSFPDRKNVGAYTKERVKNKKKANEAIRRIATLLGFTVKIGFARTKGDMLTPSVTITGERGS
jgi:hypothetical protein